MALLAQGVGQGELFTLPSGIQSKKEQLDQLGAAYQFKSLLNMPRNNQWPPLSLDIQFNTPDGFSHVPNNGIVVLL